MAEKIERYGIDPSDGEKYLIAEQEDFDKLLLDGKVPHFGASTRTAIRRVDKDLVPNSGWIIVDTAAHLEPVIEPEKPKPEKGAKAEPVTYDGGLVTFTKGATAEDVLTFAEANPTLLVDVLATEKAGKGRVTLIGKLNNLAAKDDK